jgi:hypothetical protein
MTSEVWSIHPPSYVIGDETISADLRRDSRTDSWEVTVVIARAPGQDLLPADAVEVQLIDGAGETIELLAGPSAPLVEAGGSLGVSANANFRFGDGSRQPFGLVVTYQNQQVQFQVVQGAGAESGNK